jgi:hypothetical protein
MRPVTIARIHAPGGQLAADSTLTVGTVTVPVPERTASGQAHRDRRIAEAARAAGYERVNGDWYTEGDQITVGVVRRPFIPGEPVIVLDEHGQPDGSGRFSALLVDGRFVIMVGDRRRDVRAIRLPRQGDAEWGVRDAVTSAWVAREFYSEAEADACRAQLAECLTGPGLLRVAQVPDGGQASGPRLAALEREVARLRDALGAVVSVVNDAGDDENVSRQYALERVAELATAALDGD